MLFAVGTPGSVIVGKGACVVPGALRGRCQTHPALNGGAISFRLLRRLIFTDPKWNGPTPPVAGSMVVESASEHTPTRKEDWSG